MTRFLRLLLFGSLLAGAALAQQQQPAAPEPPEEDEGLTKTEYEFNPLQAEKEIRVGEFYGRKGSWKAAVLRFREATRWNPSLAEAWIRLGDAEAKLKNREEAQEAWKKFLELAPEDKRAADVRKKVAEAKPAGKKK